MDSKELNHLKWVGIALAGLTTIFTLVIVASHLSGRLVGLGKVGIIGTVGAELMCVFCAWKLSSKNKTVAGVAMLCQIILTAVLLINATIALDLDWQETQAEKADLQKIEREKVLAEEQRKTIEKQAELAAQLAQQDKRLAREFIRSGTRNDKSPNTTETDEPKAEKKAHVQISELSVYERYGLTSVPLILALLTAVALGLAAQNGKSNSSSSQQSDNETKSEFPRELPLEK